MGVKFHLFLLSIALGVTVLAYQASALPNCDWPIGVCAFVNDSCPPDIPIDCKSEYYCALDTNKCCCREKPPPPTPPGPHRCDWPVGVCVYYKDPCPPDIPYPCPEEYCPLATNKCCCRSSP